MVLRCSLKQAVLWRLMASNPSDAVKPPRADRKEMRTLSEEEVRRLLAATAGTRHHSLWIFLVTTGVRLGEALALKWADIDLVEGHATIRRALQRQRGVGMVFVEPKSSRGRRTVPFPTRLLKFWLPIVRTSTGSDRRRGSSGKRTTWSSRARLAGRET